MVTIIGLTTVKKGILFRQWFQQTPIMEVLGLERTLVAMNKCFEPEHKVRGAITKIFKVKFEGAWTSWGNVDKNMRDTWFDDFKATYKWLDKDEDQIKKSFNTRGSIALKNVLLKVRSGEDESGWIDEEYLEVLRVLWEKDEDWLKISEINKQNRHAQEGHNVQSGGSISAREHAKKMEMFQSQLIERQLQSGEGVGEQSTHNFDDAVFLEVVGGLNKKGRILGIGSHASVFKESLKGSNYRDATSDEVSMLKGEVQTLTTELKQKNVEQENIKRKVDTRKCLRGLYVDKNLKALLDAPEEESNYCDEKMGEAEMEGYLFDSI